MDVELQADDEARTEPPLRGPGARLLRRKRRFDPARTWIDLFGEWQKEEVSAAERYPECGGLTPEQLEEIYQETVIALLDRHYDNEDHARHALRRGLKDRALNFHRDERRRQEILDTAMSLDPPNGHGDDSTERAVLVREDRLVVAEFLTELTSIEQKVFWLQAEGMKYRSIAKALSVEINTARNAARSCERKREHFQLLYDTGRLCGYRARTIHALQNGKATSEDLAQRAFAHLESCARCRAEHCTNAQRLRRTFQGQAAVLLPVPAFLHHLGWLARIDARLRTIQHRLTPNGMTATPGGVRERAVALFAGSGATAKAAAGVVTVAAIAGGTIGISHSLGPAHKAHARPHVRPQHLIPAAEGMAATPVVLTGPSPGSALPRTHSHTQRHSPPAFGPGHTVPYPSRQAVQRISEQQHEPPGFAYLGVPASDDMPHDIPSPTLNTTGPRSADTSARVSGGPFTP